MEQQADLIAPKSDKNKKRDKRSKRQKVIDWLEAMIRVFCNEQSRYKENAEFRKYSNKSNRKLEDITRDLESLRNALNEVKKPPQKIKEQLK